MTVEVLAGKIGVNKAHISRLERGIKVPSPGMMSRLAHALGTTIGHVMGETLQSTDVRVTRQAGIASHFIADEQHRFAHLGHGQSISSFEAFVVMPGSGGRSSKAQHGGQEMLYVLAGTIDIVFVDRTERLYVGDCVRFAGYLTHSIARVGRAKASALLVLSST